MTETEQTAEMKKLTVLENVLPKKLSEEFLELAEGSLNQLHKDYFPEKSFEEFFKNHMGHTSLFAKILTFRFFSSEIMLTLKQHVAPKIEEIYGEEQIMMHPIFYLRFSFPGELYPISYRDIYLDSQPHYDRAFGLYAYSFWLALVDIDSQTGGLCSFTDPYAINLFDADGVNRYNLDTYKENAKKLDPILREATEQPALKAGSMFTFDSNLLHAATKPIGNKPRISLDFRMFPKCKYDGMSPRVKAVIREFNDSPSYCNAMNLFYCGDYIGAVRKLESIENKTEKIVYLINCLKKQEPHPKMHEPHLQMRWQDEYGWV